MKRYYIERAYEIIDGVYTPKHIASKIIFGAKSDEEAEKKRQEIALRPWSEFVFIDEHPDEEFLTEEQIKAIQEKQ